MIAAPSMPSGAASQALKLEMKGRFSDKVQIAETFQSAYDVLDRLCDSGVQELSVVYHADFQVDEVLRTEFARAAREALSYKEALTFGRDIPTRVVGLDAISCGETRAMALSLHRRS